MPTSPDMLHGVISIIEQEEREHRKRVWLQDTRQFLEIAFGIGLIQMGKERKGQRQINRAIRDGPLVGRQGTAGRIIARVIYIGAAKRTPVRWRPALRER